MRVSIKTALSRVPRYVQELALCHRLGADGWSRRALMRATLLFHLWHGWNNPKQTLAYGRRVYRLRIGSRVVSVALRTYGGDLFIFHEVFLGECYRIPPQWLQRHEVRTVVDLGAHIGLTSLFFLQQFPQARYVCVEANPENVDFLRYNLSCMANQVQILPGAVGDTSGTVFFATDGPTWHGHISDHASGAAAIRSYCMAEILASSGVTTVDLLKVDIEGAEQRLFRTNAEWLRNVKIIIIELHEGYSPEDFAMDVAPHGLRVISPDPALGNHMVCAIADAV